MIKTIPKSLNTNYPLSLFMGLVFSISLSYSFAQAELTPNASPQTNSDSEKDANSRAKGQISKEVLEKAKAIQASDASPEEKRKMLAELGINNPQLLENQNYFSGKYIPTQLIEKLQEMYGAEAKTFLANIVIVNPAIAIDYNIYVDAEKFSKQQEISKSYVFDEKTTLLWVIPDLNLMKTYLRATNEQLVESAQLYFKNKPELYNFIPIEIQKMLQSTQEISSLLKMQLTYRSSFKF
jgi:hypothetical protein